MQLPSLVRRSAVCPFEHISPVKKCLAFRRMASSCVIKSVSITLLSFATRWLRSAKGVRKTRRPWRVEGVLGCSRAPIRYVSAINSRTANLTLGRSKIQNSRILNLAYNSCSASRCVPESSTTTSRTSRAFDKVALSSTAVGRPLLVTRPITIAVISASGREEPRPRLQVGCILVGVVSFRLGRADRTIKAECLFLDRHG